MHTYIFIQKHIKIKLLRTNFIDQSLKIAGEKDTIRRGLKKAVHILFPQKLYKPEDKKKKDISKIVNESINLELYIHQK